MTDISVKWLLDSIQALGGDYDFAAQTNTASLLLEPRTSALLGIPEYSQLDFNPEPSAVGIDITRLKEKIGALSVERGSTIAVRINPGNTVSYPSQKKAEKFLSSANGKVIFKEVRPMNQTYLVVYARFSAVSDEKRSFLSGAAINASSLTIAPQLPLVLDQRLQTIIPLSESMQFSVPDRAAINVLSNLLKLGAEQELIDFRESMRKRMARDSSRLYNYYSELYEAARNPSARKKTEPAMIKSNVDAIASEYSKKIEDLRIKYLTLVTVEPLSVVELVVPALVSTFDVCMGNRILQKSIAWNPLTSLTDQSICDCCSGPVESSHVCRDLHWLCNNCWKTCTACGRCYCVLCKPRGCTCVQ